MTAPAKFYVERRVCACGQPADRSVFGPYHTLMLRDCCEKCGQAKIAELEAYWRDRDAGAAIRG